MERLYYLVLLLFVMDIFLTNAAYLAFYDIYGNLKNIGRLGVDFMDIFFSESFQIVVVVLFLLVLFQVLGLVDVAMVKEIYPFTTVK